MEDILLNLVNGLGISGLGFIFAFLLLKQKEKSDEQTLIHIDEIEDKVSKLIDEVNNLKLVETQNTEAYKYLSESSTSSYTKIKDKIEAQDSRIDEIYTLCIKMYEHTRKTPIGEIALSKGYLTEEQLKECLEIQKKKLT